MQKADIIYGKRLTILIYTIIRQGISDGVEVTVGYVFNAVTAYNDDHSIYYDPRQLRKRINRRIAELRNFGFIDVEWRQHPEKRNQYQIIKHILS